MADITPETSIAQTELTLVALRQEALQILVNQRHGSSYTSEAKRTNKGLLVTTANDSDHSKKTMLVNGSAAETAPVSAFFGHALHLEGDFTIDHLDGKKPEKDQFALIGTASDHFWDRDDKFNLSMSRKDASGANIQTYEPAISAATSAVSPYGHGDQQVRIARPAGSDDNCQADNLANPGNHRMECDFIVHDKNLADISYNETREKDRAGFYYRSVVRDMKGHVLGVVLQNYNLDNNGDLTSVHTSARLPR